MDKNCVIVVNKKLYFDNILGLVWTWNEFSKFRTGSGSQNMTVHSFLHQTQTHFCHFLAVSPFFDFSSESSMVASW